MARLEPDLERMLHAMHDPSSDIKGDEVVGLSVKYSGDVENLRRCGMVVMGDAGGVAIGDIRLDRLEALAALDNVEAIHAPSRVHAHLDTSVPEIHADVIRTGVPGYTGAGVIVGIVDTGIDILHNNFRMADNVTTRILALWDQTLVAAAGESAPAGFGALGVEFTPAQITAAIKAKNESFRHQDVNGHGSHVAGIAAGNGSQSGNCHTAFFYRGVAPEADLVIVKALPDANSANKATDIQKAVQYIFNQATAAGKPCVVNMSLGHATGSHDGTDAEDVFFDGLLSTATGPVAGRAIVVSGGNDGSLGTIDDISTGWYKNGNHTSGHISANGTSQPIQFMVPPNDKSADFFDLRYSSAGQLQFTVTEPGGTSIGPIAYNAGTGTAAPLAGNNVAVDAIPLAPKRNQFAMTISPPAGGAITSGQWSIVLREVSGNPVDYDIWIATSHQDPYPVFVYGQRVQARTLGGPGTAKNVITVASYGSETGVLADSSSRGPTLAADNRQKPEIAAPGLESAPASGIVAPKSRARGVFYCCDCCVDFYVDMQGTSMAAPHVTGVVALMLQKDKTLTFDKIKTALQTSARDPGGGVAKPNNDWGYGKIDAQQAMTKVIAPGGGGGGGGGSVAFEPIEPPVPTPLGKLKFSPSSPASPALVEVSKETPAANSYFAAETLPIARKLNEMIVRNRENPAAQLLAALVSTHIDEVYQLIHSNRRVATMWHRMNGPTMMRSVLIAADQRADDRPGFPDRLSGNQLSGPLDRLLSLLQRYGSKRLSDDVSNYRPLVFAIAGSTLPVLRGHNVISFEEKAAKNDGFATGNP